SIVANRLPLHRPPGAVSERMHNAAPNGRQAGRVYLRWTCADNPIKLRPFCRLPYRLRRLRAGDAGCTVCAASGDFFCGAQRLVVAFGVFREVARASRLKRRGISGVDGRRRLARSENGMKKLVLGRLAAVLVLCAAPWLPAAAKDTQLNVYNW